MDEIHRKVCAKLIIGTKTYPIYVGVNTIGRNRNAIVTIKNLNVSQHQALIVVIDDTQHFVSDIMSSNGTSLNGTKLAPFNLYQLKDNAEIVFGDVKATYLVVTPHCRNSLQMDLTCIASQTQTQSIYSSTTQLIENRHNSCNQSFLSQETEGYSNFNELETQEADYPLLPNLIPEKVTSNVSVQDYIFLKPKDLDDNDEGLTTNVEMTNREIATADCEPASAELVPSEPLSETELIVQCDPSDKQTNTESTEIILSEGTLESSSNNAPMQAVIDVAQVCDQQDENHLTSNISLEKTTAVIPSDIPVQSVAPKDPKNNSTIVEILQVTDNKVDAENNVTDVSTIPQSIFTLSRKSLRSFGGTLCNESVGSVSHTSTSSGIEEQLVNESTANTNSDSNDSINFLKLGEEDMLSKSRCVAFKKNKISKIRSGSIGRVRSDSDTDSDDFSPIQKTKTTKVNSESDSQIEVSQEIGYRRKSVKKLDSDENSDSETDCEEELKKVTDSDDKGSLENKEKFFDDSECIPATQDDFTDTTGHSKMKPTYENLTVKNNALEGKELLISNGKDVKTTNHSSEESFKLGISEYILDEADQEVNKILSINGNLESQKGNKDDTSMPEVIREGEEIDKTDKGQEKENKDTQILLNSNQSGLNKVTDFLIPSQNFNDELYTIGTQRLTQNECFPGLSKLPNVDSQNDDIFLMSTQPLKPTEDLSQSQTAKKYCFKKKTVNLNESLNTLLGPQKGVCNDVITQQIDGIGNGETVNEKLDITKENDTIFIQPTQCMQTSVKDSSRPLEDDCFVIPMQPLSTQTTDTNVNVDKATDENLHDSKNKSTDDQIKSSRSINQHLNTSSQILFEDLNASQDQVDDHFVIPAQLSHAEVIGTSKILVAGSSEKSPKNTSSENSTETLSQIDSFVKQSCSEPKSTKDVTNVVENFEETLSQIDTFIKQTFVKPKEKCSEIGNNANKTLVEMPSENQNEKNDSAKCGAIEESSNNILDLNAEVSTSDPLHGVPNFCSTPINESETLSQIEEFVKNTSVDLKNKVNNEKSTEVAPRSTKTKNVPKLNSPKTTVTKTTRRYKQRIPVKEVDCTLENLSESSDDDFVDSSNQKKGKKGNTKQNINQTYIHLLESKNTKIKKSNKIPTGLDELKVTVGSNRRSMDITQSTCLGVSTRNSKRKIEQNSASSNTKRQPKETCDIGKPKTNRRGTRQAPLSSEIPNVQANLNSSEVPTNNNKTSEPMTNENDQSEHSVPPKKRKYTRKAASKETKDITETVSVRQSRKKSASDPHDQLDATNTSRSTSKNLDPSSDCGSSERSKRKQRPKVVFTMLDSPQLESQIRQMGGSIVDTVDKCTVLMTEQVKRSVKLLQAIGQGKPICSPAWILASKKEHEFVDPWDYILVDKEAETKWKFSLKESLMRASRNKLLDNYMFQILTTTAVDVLKGAIEVCGGKCVTKCPVDRSGPFFVIATPEQKSKYAKMVKKHPDIQIIEPEAIFDGVLRQELRFDRHLLL